MTSFFVDCLHFYSSVDVCVCVCACIYMCVCVYVCVCTRVSEMKTLNMFYLVIC